MSTPESIDALVELADAPVRSRTRTAMAVGAAVLLLGGVLALGLTREGEPSATAALAQIRRFVNEARTATFAIESESTTAPESGELGHSSSSRSRSTGSLRLPDAAHTIVDDGDYVSEFVSLGEDQYTRDGESREELAEAKWVRFSGPSPEDGSASLGAFVGVPPDEVAIEAAVDVMSAISPTNPTELDSLLDKLEHPERFGPNRIQATVELADLLPDEAKRAFEEMQAELEDREDDDFMTGFSPLDGTVTVIIEYGPEGRLDVLEVEVVQDEEKMLSTEHDVIRFADWGKPVTIEAPADDRIDHMPHIDDEQLAAVQQRYTVFALTAPPAGWELLSLYVESRDEESETCESVSVEYGQRGADADSDEPPAIEVVSLEPDCPWLDDGLPDMSKARQLRVGAFTARLAEDAQSNHYTFLSDGRTAVLDIGTTTVVAASNLPEEQFLQVLGTLASLDLSRQPVADAPR